MADDFILSDAEREALQKRRHRIYIGLIALLVALVLGLIVARPVRRSIRGWQARRHAEKAFVLIGAQKWSAARDEATAAYQLQPKEPAAVPRGRSPSLPRRPGRWSRVLEKSGRA